MGLAIGEGSKGARPAARFKFEELRLSGALKHRPQTRTQVLDGTL